MSVRVQAVEGKQDLHAFVTLPWRLYAGDRQWIPPLIGDTKKLFDRRKNPFFDHGDIRPFLARRENRVVGRIAAIRNRAHEAFHEEAVGFFGFFECEDDGEAAAALFEAVRGYLRSEGLEVMRGPMNPSTNEDCGLLVEGFDTPPMVMMPHGRPYYPALVEACGFTRVKDLYAFLLTAESIPTDLARGNKLARRKNPDVEIRPLDKSRFREEVEAFREVYNSAWERNWGFIPMTDREIDHMAEQLKPVVEPGLIRVARHKGRPIGFALGLPDLNQALKHANGRLFPVGLLRILWHARRLKRARILVLGLVKEYRRLGIDVMLYYDLFTYGMEKGYTTGEFSWILEDNLPMVRPIETMGGKRYKTYRIYDAPVTPS